MAWLILRVLGTRRVLWTCVPIHFFDFLLSHQSGSGLDPVIPIFWLGGWGTSLLSWFWKGDMGSLQPVIGTASFLGFTDCLFLLLSKEAVLEQSCQNCQSRSARWCHVTCSSFSVNLIFLQSRIRGIPARAKRSELSSIITETTRRSIFNIGSVNPRILCSQE